MCALLLLMLLGYVLFEVSNTVYGWWVTNHRPPVRGRRLLPNAISLWHALAFMPLKLAYMFRIVRGAVVTGMVCAFPSLRLPITEAHVVEEMLETSLVLFVSLPPATKNQPAPGCCGGCDGPRKALFHLAGFAVPWWPEKFDNEVTVEFDLASKSVLMFEINGTPITSCAEMLAVLSVLVGTVTHPLAHSFNNALYASRRRPGAARVPELFLHGQPLNNAAHYYPGLGLGSAPSWMRRLLCWNAEQRVPPHRTEALEALRPYSRLCRFLLGARPAVFRLVRQHGVPVDAELFFVCSVVHSLDHYNSGRIVRQRYLRHEALRVPRVSFPNLTAYTFYSPVQPWWCNNLLVHKRTAHPFYADLYAALHKLDVELTEQLSLSQAY